MPIYLDDEAVSLDGGNLGAVLRAAHGRLAGTGRAVVEVQIDGETLANDQLEARQRDAIDGRELRLYSADPHELAVDALDQVRARLAAAGILQQEAAELLQQDRGPDGLRKVAEAIEAWMQAQQAVQMAASIAGIDLEALRAGDEPATALVGELVDALKGLKEQLVAGDTVALADALAYEWPELVTKWDRLIEELIQQIESR